MGREKQKGESPPGVIRYRANPDFILREVAGEAILVPVGKASLELNGMVAFTGVSAFLWKQLEKELLTLSELVEIVTREYEIDRIRATDDITEFLNNAIKIHIVLKEELSVM